MKQHLKEWSDAKSRIETEIQRKKEHQNVASNFEVRGFVRKNWKTKNFNPENNPLLEESSEEEEDEHNPEFDYMDDEAYMIKKGRVDQVEEEEEEDEYYDENEEIREGSDYDDDEQQRKMQIMERRKQTYSEKQLKEARAAAKSAHPRARGGPKSQIEFNKPQVHDLTKDQIGYGIRPTTAIQLQQLEKITEFNKALPKRK